MLERAGSEAGRSLAVAVVLATLVWLLAAPPAPATPGSGNSAATIEGEFSDSCRDLAVGSSKDVSHVELHLADGRVSKDEAISSPEHAIDGGPGDEIDFVIVKSGTTTRSFTCARDSNPPTAVLEVRGPPDCGTFPDGTVLCNAANADRTEWWTSFVASLDFGLVRFSCPPAGCPDTSVTFRGTSSFDPEDDIVSWTLEFDDGTSHSGSWTTSPPEAVSKALPGGCAADCDVKATLTVTDSAGHTDSDTQLVDFELPD